VQGIAKKIMRIQRGHRIAGLNILAPQDHPTCICQLILTDRHGLPSGVRVRIERPKHLAGSSVPQGQSRHAHVQERIRRNWRDVYVVNKDGSGSHGTRSGTAIDEQVAEVLRARGFDIPEDNRVRFLSKWHERWMLPILKREGLDTSTIVVVVEFWPDWFE